MASILGQYIYNWLVLLSQGLNVLRGGHPDESTSQWTARMFLKYLNTGTFKEDWFTTQLKAIDLLFYNSFWQIEKNHCLASLEGESGAKDLWDY